MNTESTTINHLSFINNHLACAIRSTVYAVRKNPLFMQNKANFQKVKFYVNNEMKKDYDKMDTWCDRKNEPKTNPILAKTNPIKANLKNAQMNATKVLTKNYDNILNWVIYPKQTQFKPKQSQFHAYGRFRLYTTIMSEFFSFRPPLGISF